MTFSRMNHYTNHLTLPWTGKLVLLLILVHSLPVQCFPKSLESVNLDSIEWIDDELANTSKDDIKESSVSTRPTRAC